MQPQIHVCACADPVVAAAEPNVELVAEPVAELAAELVAELVTEPVVEPVAKGDSEAPVRALLQ